MTESLLPIHHPLHPGGQRRLRAAVHEKEVVDG